MTRKTITKIGLWAECTTLFAVLPGAYALGEFTVPKLTVLGAVTFFCLAVLAGKGIRWRREFRFQAVRPFLPLLLVRLGLVTAGATCLTLILIPDHLLAFPTERPGLWLAVMALYPLLSALPQEIIYRTFFHRRYTTLFGNGPALLLASSLAFAFLHVIYGNTAAVLLSLGGGILLGTTYEHRRSLAAAWLEHAGYGMIIFTVGLGRFFYSG